MSLTKVSYSMITGAPVNVLDYGAVGNGVADDTAAIQTALATGKSIFFPAGTYNISGVISPRSNTTWIGENNAILKWTSVNCIIYAFQVGNWTMQGLVVDGNYTAYPIVGAQKAWGIEMDECVNVTITNCVFRYLYRIGICIGHQSQTMCQNIVIDNNVIHDCGSTIDPVAGFGNGVAVLSASNVKITNNWIYNITGSVTGGTGGINLEPGSPAYNCYDIEIAGNKVTNCNNCGGIQLYMGHPTDFTGARGNINIHDNTIAVTGTAPGITCTQFGDTQIRNNQLELTQGILVKRYKAAKAIVEGNIILQVQGAGGYGIRFQDGIASAIVRGNRMTNINGIGIQVDMYDFTVPMNQKECLIQDNLISSCIGAGIAFTAGNFVISGNTLQGCANATDYYIKSLTGGVFQSVNGYIGGNTLVSASGSIAAFINIEGDLMNNVQIGPNSYVGPILPTMKTNTFNIGGRNPGVFMDVLPAAGTWQVGDIIWKATPSAGGFIGWVCTTGGTPGTWKQFGTIQA